MWLREAPSGPIDSSIPPKLSLLPTHWREGRVCKVWASYWAAARGASQPAWQKSCCSRTMLVCSAILVSFRKFLSRASSCILHYLEFFTTYKFQVKSKERVKSSVPQLGRFLLSGSIPFKHGKPWVY
jgi:hypothetical protein